MNSEYPEVAFVVAAGMDFLWHLFDPQSVHGHVLGVVEVVHFPLLVVIAERLLVFG